MELSGRLHAPATLPPERDLPVPIVYEAGCSYISQSVYIKSGISELYVYGTVF
jgi:hypothetical protein